MPRRFVVVLLLAVLGGCAKPPNLPDSIVRAADPGELAAFRADLGSRFPADRLQPLDTALQELQLDAMSRGVATTEAREQDMRARVNGRTVRAAQILGWQARRSRILGEMKLMSGLLERDLATRQRTAATGTPRSVANAIENEQSILERLQRNLQDTDANLRAWGAPPVEKP